jgi:uroporphyrinogen III methyltransferase/synthase
VPPQGRSEALRRLRDGEIDIVTFASPSAVRNLVQMLGGDVSALKKPLIACIGPVTARAARRLALQVDRRPEHTALPGCARVRSERRRDRSRPSLGWRVYETERVGSVRVSLQTQ